LGFLFSWFTKRFAQRKSRKKSKKFLRLLPHEKFKELQDLIGYPLKNKSYYIEALIHRSFLEDNEQFGTSNERLEFLGDSVLNLVAAQFLFENFPDEDEGFLTKIRSRMVNRTALSEAAEQIRLSRYLLISKNLQSSFVNGSKTILADALEALIGAVYFDMGLDPAKDFINRVIINPLIKEGDYLVDENYKSQLLEYAQANHLDNPNYEVIKAEGPQHARIFTVRVSIGNEVYGEGRGKNKKTAEQNAANAALNKLNIENS
jgi:ribonuclease III